MAYPGLVLAIVAGVAVGSMLYYLFASSPPQQQSYSHGVPRSTPAITAAPIPKRSTSPVRRRKRKDSGGRDGIDECSICCDSLFAEGSRPVETPCGHYYHSSCIGKWLKIQRTCPNCKATIENNIVI